MCHHLQLIQSSHRKEEELLSQILQVILKERKQRQTGPWPPRSKAFKIRKHLGRFSTGYRKWSSANGIFGRRREDQFGDNGKRCMKISFYVPAMREPARWCHQNPPPPPREHSSPLQPLPATIFQEWFVISRVSSLGTGLRRCQHSTLAE